MPDFSFIASVHALWWVAIVILISGALGGVVSALISQQSETDRSQLSLVQSAIIGIGAALIIPLFLNSISSRLIDDIVGLEGAKPRNSLYFVLAGFCILAAIIARRFIETMAATVFANLQDKLEKVDQKAQAAKEDAGIAKAASSQQIEEDETSQLAREDGKSSVLLSDDEKAILHALTHGRLTVRSLSGIANDSGLSGAAVNPAIGLLIQKGLVTQFKGSKGQPRWSATSDGRILAGSLFPTP